ncbi:MAG: hypothetical protein KDB00_16655 [Planctomycetales bacterium]|nr:hypothetical protein [Planctomycetales bacterium]
MKSRRSSCELFEPRQLLAGDVCLADAPSGAVVAAELAPAELASVSTQIGTNQADGTGSFSGQNDIARSAIVSPVIWELAGWDLLAEQGGQVVAVRSHYHLFEPGADRPAATAYLFDRQEDGSLVQSGSIELSFMPQELILTEQMILVVGRSFSNVTTGVEPLPDLPAVQNAEFTVLLAINRDDLTQKTRLTVEGTLETIAQSGDRLFVSTYPTPSLDQLMIYPPLPVMHHVTVFDIGGEVPVRSAVGELPSTVTENMIVGNDIVVVSQAVHGGVMPLVNFTVGNVDVVQPDILPEPVSTSLIRYRIDGGKIDEVARLELPWGLELKSEISGDGMTAVVYSSPLPYPVPATDIVNQIASSVHLIDLSQDQPVLFQTVEIPTQGIGSVVEIGERALVVADGRESLLVVNIDQSIDIDAKNRVRRIALSSDPNRSYPGVTSVAEVTADLYVVARQSYFTVNAAASILPSSTYDILVVSLNDGAVVSETTVDATTLAIFAPDASTPDLIRLYPLYGLTDSNQLVVGSISETGKFSTTASIDLTGTLEVDADENRLILRQIDQLVEYRWDDLGHPIFTPLGEPLPAPLAVDDIFERNAESRDRYLDVLANDQIVQHAAVGLPQIVELIGAPAGVVIAPGGQLLRLTDDATLSDGTFQFDYVLSQGREQSTATVTLTLFHYDNSDVRQAVQRIVAQAAVDLGVEESEIQIGNEQRWTSRVMPELVGDSVANPLGGQFGVIVDLVVANELYRYAANFENDVVQLKSRQLATVMSLSMRIVDADGNALESVKTGDEFFVEVIAQDLREFGQGVFAVAFDLPVPANQLELTGEVVLLGAFDDVGTPVIGDGVDEFSALETLIEHPGNASQPVVRFGLRAIAGGVTTLRLDPAESLGAELLLRGNNEEISPIEVDFGTLEFSIDGVDPTDTDANGAVTPADALRVINFLGLYGTVAVDQLETLNPGAEGETRVAEINAMRRLDTNADGKISARDALQVINKLARVFSSANAEAESPGVATQIGFLDDDDDEFGAISI